ncbi:MAG TPA: Hpt domain-containing protein, partial [Quisquiliibacterium sp.]|nr:Hpt domain-containing protein [Quisquiliibacterium sp.]
SRPVEPEVLFETLLRWLPHSASGAPAPGPAAPAADSAAAPVPQALPGATAAEAPEPPEGPGAPPDPARPALEAARPSPEAARPSPDAARPPPEAAPCTLEPLLSELDDLDIRQGLSFVGGRPDTYERMLALFVDVHARDADQIRAALDAGDHDALRQRAHAVRGASGIIGARTVQQAAESLERAAREGASPERLASDTRQLCDRLAHVIEVLRGHLRTVDAARDASGASGASDDRGRSQGAPVDPVLLLDRLEAMLGVGDMDANALAERHHGQLRQLPGGLGDELLRAIAAFDYTSALHLIGQVRAVSGAAPSQTTPQPAADTVSDP